MVRVKHRYLLVNFLYPDTTRAILPSSPVSAKQKLPEIVQFNQPTPDYLTPSLLIRSIRDQVELLYGEYGAGIAANGLKGKATCIHPVDPAYWISVVNYLSPATSTAIIRCPYDHFRLIWAALTFMTHLPKPAKQAQSKPCVIRVVRVSGTIKKSEQEAIRRARATILKAKSEAEGKTTGSLESLLGPADAQQGISAPKKGGHAVLSIEDDDGEEEDMESDSEAYD